MPITIMTDEALGLLDDIYDQIERNKIRTWRIQDTSIGEVFWYKAAQYEGVACLLPTVTDEMLTLDIYAVDGFELDDAITGVYYGRFVQMITGHYYGQYNISSITIN